MNFVSDNAAGVAPEIMDAIAAANGGTAPSYGRDDRTEGAHCRLAEVFEHEVAAALVTTGSAANGLALAMLAPPYGAVLAQEAAHVQMDECGAPEFFTGGAKLVPLATDGGKVTEAALRRALANYPSDAPETVHRVRPSCLSLSQPTEYGAVYSLAELESLCGLAHEAGLSVHLDGARFANALVTLGCSPAEASWNLGVDALSLGLTKNGCMAAEAVVLFDARRTRELAWRVKRAGQLLSKGRFLGAQVEAALQDGLWLSLASRANASAVRLATGLADVPGVEIVAPVESNAVFAVFPERIERRLREAGVGFLSWKYPGDRWDGRLRRLMTSFRTREEDIERLLALAGGAATTNRVVQG
ncbi:MAG TPA: beta-eliminating lyase-related protein [Woeseiaceae bacterium]|nr:beta-eliminating lyase-related protein [Woeseiaceae bacterium]